VNLLRDNVNNIKKNTETLVDVSKEDDIEINTEHEINVDVSLPECRAKY
jgi:hypothetical protein